MSVGSAVNSIRLRLCRFHRILQVLSKSLKLSSDVDLRKLAKRTPGYVGNDLRSLVNKAQIRRNRRLVVAENCLH